LLNSEPQSLNAFQGILSFLYQVNKRAICVLCILHASVSSLHEFCEVRGWLSWWWVCMYAHRLLLY